METKKKPNYGTTTQSNLNNFYREKEMSEITPFTINIPEAQLTDLRDRINNTRWVEEECVNDWSQGIPLTYVREIADYWATQYDWRKSEQQNVTIETKNAGDEGSYLNPHYTKK